MRAPCSNMSAMERRRTRTSPATPPPRTVVLLLLSAAVILFMATGCAPHRRGRLEVADPGPPPRPRPAVESAEPAEPAPESRTTWKEIDRSASPADQVAAMAATFVGTPYRWGGATPRGFDCSGLVHFVYGKVGIDLPRRAIDQSRSGRVSDLGKLAKGDLVFFKMDRNIISHVGIYVGDGEFIHAPGTGKVVRRDRIDDQWWRRRVKTVRRILKV